MGLLLVAGLVSCRSWMDTRRWNEPEAKWFTTYSGPMRSLDQVGVLCKESADLDITRIRSEVDGRSLEARHEKWHFPPCIEALPGRYTLAVGYFSRDTVFETTATITETTESPVPMEVEWEPEAGGVYELRAVLGSMAPLPGLKPRSPRESATTEGRWYLRRWELEIERLESWEDVSASAREAREIWRRHQ